MRGFSLLISWNVVYSRLLNNICSVDNFPNNMHKRIKSVASRMEVITLPFKWRIENFEDLIEENWYRLDSPPLDIFPDCCRVRMVLLQYTGARQRYYEVAIEHLEEKIFVHLRLDHCCLARFDLTPTSYYFIGKTGKEEEMSSQSMGRLWYIKVDEAKLLEQLDDQCLELRMSLKLTILVDC